MDLGQKKVKVMPADGILEYLDGNTKTIKQEILKNCYLQYTILEPIIQIVFNQEY